MIGKALIENRSRRSAFKIKQIKAGLCTDCVKKVCEIVVYQDEKEVERKKYRLCWEHLVRLREYSNNHNDRRCLKPKGHKGG